MSEDATMRIEPGMRAPDFVGRRPDGTPVRWYGRAGGAPTILLLGAECADTPSLEALSRGVGASAHTVLHVLARGGEAPTIAAAVETLLDADGRVHEHLGAPEGTARLLVLDPNLRVLRLLPGDAVEEALTCADAGTPGEEERIVVTQAPVLLIPRVLDDGLCAELIEQWRAAGHRKTGVEASSDGRRRETLDPGRKRRRDHTVSEPELLRRLTTHLGQRILPEVNRAFAYRATRFEGFKIGRYGGAEGGWFRAHRDNLSPATAHRRFALTLNLNEDYEGGGLRFPEHGPHLYRPAAGEALVFSGSLLHEVLPVTRGERFVLLSFLFARERGAGSR